MDKSFEPSQTGPLPQREGQVPAIPPARVDAALVAERAPLTRRNLALFDKMGQQRKKSTPAGDSMSIRDTSITTTGFALKSRKNGILLAKESQPPTNLGQIRKRHSRSGGTAPPTGPEHGEYADMVSDAGTEMTMLVEVSGFVLKRHGDFEYKREFNRCCDNAPRNAGYNNGLSAPQPDFVEGLRMLQFDPFPVDDHLPGAVLYQDDPCSITLPHVAGEWKARTGDMDEARLQAAYDGAAMVYGRNMALAYMGESDPPGHAAVTTFITDGTSLKMYAHYAMASPKVAGRLEYHQYEYASTDIRSSYQGYVRGRRGLRNAQDHAREQSYALRDQLVKYWEQQQQQLQRGIAEEEPLLALDGVALGETSAEEEEEKKEKEEEKEKEKEEAEEEEEEAPPAAAAAVATGSRQAPGRSRHTAGGGGNRKRKALASPPRPRPRASLRPRRSTAKYC